MGELIKHGEEERNRELAAAEPGGIVAAHTKLVRSKWQKTRGSQVGSLITPSERFTFHISKQ